MSEREQHEVIGRLVLECMEAKRLRNLLQTDIRTTANVLVSVGEQLKKGSYDDAMHYLQNWGGPANADLGALKFRIEEAIKLGSKIRELDEQLAALGIKQQ
jgi:hypothetical protein